MTDRYAVFGNPIGHSKSPQLHRLFAEQTGQDMHYDAQLVPLDGFRDSADRFFANGGKGLNITVPFKSDAFDYASQLTERACLAGAVNTLALQSERMILGDNTDGVGLLRDITVNLGWPVRDRSVLILGAGGAVRGVLGPLLEQQPSRVVIANRTLSKAQQLAADFSDLGTIEACSFEQLAGHQLSGQGFDLLINGTSASLSGNLPPLPEGLLTASSGCYDMMYGAQPTPFMVWGREHGAAVADGLGMLVEQGAEAFYLWRGVRPDTTPVLAHLRAELDAAAG